MPEKLTDSEVDAIAERAAQKAIVKVYEQIGRSVAEKVFWFIGVVVVGMLLLVAGKGVIAS
jgi:hypothetical protein